MTLGREIKRARAGLGWQQQQLARETGISQKYLSRVENDKADPSWSIVHRIAHALRLDLNTLAWEEAAPTPATPAKATRQARQGTGDVGQPAQAPEKRPRGRNAASGT